MNFEKMAEVSKFIKACTICPKLELCHVTGSIVKNEAEDPSKLVFVGEAPGEVEALKGIPFCGPSGVFLRNALDHSGKLSYTLLNVLKCKPPGNRDPTFTEAKACYPYLRAQIEALGPEKVVALGKIADEALTALRIKHVSINHPSHALRKEMKAEEYSVEIVRALYEEKIEKEVITGLLPSLHTHSNFSIADSLQTPDEIVEFAKAGGMPALALTDHGTLAGVYDFEDAALKAGLPYIIGYEAYVSDVSLDKRKETITFNRPIDHDGIWSILATTGTSSGSRPEIRIGNVADISYQRAIEMAQKCFDEEIEKSKDAPSSALAKYMKKNSLTNAYFAWKDEQTTGHMNIWVTSQEGWGNLLYLHNEAAKVSTDRKAHVFLDSIKTHAKGLVFGSACIGGFLAQKLLYHGDKVALKWLEDFSNDLRTQGTSFILEVMPHAEVEIKPHPTQEHQGLTQARLNRFLLDAGAKLRLNVIVTTDAHYLRSEDKEAKMQAMAMAYHKKEIYELYLRPDPTKDAYFPGNSYYFMTEKEVTEALSFGEEIIGVREEEIDNLIHVTKMLAEYLAGKHGETQTIEPFRLPRDFPHIELDGIDFEIPIIDLAWPAFVDSHLSTESEETIQLYHDRLMLEIDRIKRKGFGWYFKIEKKFSDELIGKDIPVGPGRGSAGGSLIAYVQGITHIDPIKHGLLFERFMSEERNDPPDIDLDVATSRRGEAIDILSGILKVQDIACIMDYGRWKKDMAARDVCWLLDKDQYEFEHRGAGMKEIQPLVDKLINRIRYRGTHASGFIGLNGLDKILPLAKLSATKDIPSIEFELNTLNRLNIAKFDILGLTELDNIYMREDRITRVPIIGKVPEDYQGETFRPIIEGMEEAGLWHEYEFFINKIPPEEMRRLLVDVATPFPVGLFQIKTSAGNMTMNELKPETFEELVNVIAINRPGPRDSGMVELYKKRKFDGELYDALPSTESTYGCPIFQEQILVILNKVFGMTLGEADEVRRHISKKKLDKLQKVEEGLTEALLDPEKRMIWDQVMNWAAYGFNKAHATTYAVLSVMTIWAKDHMPETFYAHFLNLEPERVKRRAALREAIALRKDNAKIKIVRPNAKYPHGEKFLTYQSTIVEKGKDGKEQIVLGFNSIKGLAEKTSAKVVAKLVKGYSKSKKSPLTPLQEVLLQKAGFWGPEDEPFLDGTLPLSSAEVVPWYSFVFPQAALSLSPPGTSGQMTLIIHEGTDHIVRVEDNGGAYRLYSQLYNGKGPRITKEDLKAGIIKGLFYKGNNDKVYLIEKETDGDIAAVSKGFRVVYSAPPRTSKAGNNYCLCLMKVPAKDDNKPERVIESVIMAPEEYLKKIHRGVILLGTFSNGFFKWDYQRQIPTLSGEGNGN